jgi:hypothetical protein
MLRKQHKSSLRRISTDPQRPLVGSITGVMACSAPNSTQSRARRQVQHWTFTQRPFYRNRKHRQMLGLLLALPAASTSVERGSRALSKSISRGITAKGRRLWMLKSTSKEEHLQLWRLRDCQVSLKMGWFKRNYLYYYDNCQKRRRKHHSRYHHQGCRREGSGVR